MMNMKNVRILGNNITVDNNSHNTLLNNNDLIIGSSGAGKTTGYVTPNIINSEESFICADTKCSLYEKLGKGLKKKGYKVFLVDFVDPERSCVYNPLDYIQYNKKTGEYRQQDIISIANTLVPDNLDDEKFWVNSARTVVECLISYVLEAFVPEEHNLATVLEVYKVFSNYNASEIAQKGIPFLEEWAMAHPDSPAASAYHLFKGNACAEKMWSSINGFAALAFKAFDFKEARGMFNGKTSFRFEDLGRRKCAVFLNISDTDRSLDKLVNIFYTQALQTLCKAADNDPTRALKIPARIYLDDFAANVVIPDFDKTISIIRSRNISVSVILQSMSQLNAMYGADRALTIVNNCDHIIYLGANDLNTANFIADRANKTPETIMCMPASKEYVLVRGQKAILADKVTPQSELFAG